MPEENKWRITPSGFGTDSGFDTSDVETFKKDPVSSLAREIVQNSIDARKGDYEGPVRVDFKLSKVSIDEFPGLEDFKKLLEGCARHKQQKPKDMAKIKTMENALKSGFLKVLRISDYHTSGLTKLKDGDVTGRWHSLVKESGTSQKSGGSLGSKGIGKFATFANSVFRTVFYSSVNEDGERGYEGIAKLCSGSIEGSDDYTTGPAYFCRSDRKDAILEDLPYSWAEKRNEGETGTDIYILGFEEDSGWKEEAALNILESFIVAIYRENLSVNIDGLLLDKENLPKALQQVCANSKDEKCRRAVSQYHCLLDTPDVKCINIDLQDERYKGQLELRMKACAHGSAESDYCYNACVVVREPFMKIKEYRGISTSTPITAVLIIKKGPLNDFLRSIENPQHSDWYYRSLEDRADQRYAKELIDEIRKEVYGTISENAPKSESKETDFYNGADYLPDLGSEGEARKIIDDPDDKPIVSKAKQSQITHSEGYEESPYPETVVPDIGSVDQTQEGDALFPEGHNAADGGLNRPGEGEGKPGEGDEPIFVKKNFREMHQTIICLDKKESMYRLYVVPKTNETNVRFKMVSYDDSGQKEYMKILSCTLDGASLPIAEEGTAVEGFAFDLGKPRSFDMKLDTRGYFSGKAEFYADRR